MLSTASQLAACGLKKAWEGRGQKREGLTQGWGLGVGSSHRSKLQMHQHMIRTSKTSDTALHKQHLGTKGGDCSAPGSECGVSEAQQERLSLLLVLRPAALAAAPPGTSE